MDILSIREHWVLSALDIRVTMEYAIFHVKLRIERRKCAVSQGTPNIEYTEKEHLLVRRALVSEDSQDFRMRRVLHGENNEYFQGTQGIHARKHTYPTLPSAPSEVSARSSQSSSLSFWAAAWAGKCRPRSRRLHHCYLPVPRRVDDDGKYIDTDHG